MQHEPLAYQVQEAVRVSGLARTRLYDAMRAGALPFQKVGRRTLIMRRDLIAYIEQASAASEPTATEL